MIDAGVGLSTDPDSYTAGKMAVKEALKGMSQKPKVCILAIDGITRKKFNYQEVVNGARSELDPTVRLVGSTVNGILVNDRFALRSVGVMLLGGDVDIEGQFNFPKSRLHAEKIANQIWDIKQGIPNNPNQVMLMFQDGVKFPPEIWEQQKMLNTRVASLLSGLVTRVFKKKLDDFKEVGKGMPSVQEIVTELYNKGWNIPILGNVATVLKDYISYEFYDKGVYDDACLGIFLRATGDSKFTYGFAAGGEPTNIWCKPTKAVGNFLLRIDDKPALEGFCKAINLEPESLKNLENDGFLNFFYMLGTRDKVGDKEYIHLVGTITDPSMQNLIVTAFPFDKVPEKIEIFRSNMQILMKTTKDSIEQAMAGLKKPKFFLGIDCVERLLAYGDNYPKGIELIRETIGKDVPTMVLGSGGEIFGTKKDDYYFNNFTFLSFAGGE
jgi:hypothetical protein